ncbi:hypothetical protein PHMEG_0001103 [Phytophthora megakarya]|uniref:Uncharacterized protein n=1 Tax=Phytophthora megakarya TaxID=4795 RepID=A0A225X421_9STRA|nr:hypothetical protein PHMEG_0001103 [Phytophthora megakarya]
MSDSEFKNVHLSRDDYNIIVTWMEVKANFAAIHGTGSRLAIGGKPKIKTIDVFTALATHLIRQTENEALRGAGLTGRNMQQRWSTYKSRFKRTNKKHHTETGLGISRRDLARGMSIPQKLEQMCPLYSRMQVLFGEKANITPSDTVELVTAI